jgi:hypothetical protein
MSENVTYRDLLLHLIGETIHEAVGGSPFVEEFETAVSDFVAKIRAAINSTPLVAEEFDRPIRRPLAYLPDAAVDFVREPDPLPF